MHRSLHPDGYPDYTTEGPAASQLLDLCLGEPSPNLHSPIPSEEGAHPSETEDSFSSRTMLYHLPSLNDAMKSSPFKTCRTPSSPTAYPVPFLTEVIPSSVSTRYSNVSTSLLIDCLQLPRVK